VVEPTDVTIEILRGIRDEVRGIRDEVQGTNRRVDETNTRLDDTNARIETLGEELGRRIVESELRTATAITDLAGSVREVTGLLRGQFDLRPRVERCELEILELQARLGAR
jgi:hypothetical protein